MKAGWILALALLALPGATPATTPITGSLKDLGTNASSGYVRFTLKGCSGNQPFVPGVAVLAPTNGANWFKDFAADASGNISGTLYSTRDSTGLLGGDIECGTSFTSVWYGMAIWVGGKAGPEISVHARNGVTLNVGTVVPLTTNPVATAPTGDSTYARLDGANMPFSGNVTAPRLISTVAIGTAPLSVTSTTQVPNLNASQLGGLNPPGSAILGLTDSQSPTNKTFNVQSNTFTENTPTAGNYFRDNGTSFQPSAIPAGDLPASTSQCSGVQFSQGLNSGGVTKCATPPTFVASGASHAVGYVPDPGSSAGTTRFLREDATFAVPPGGTSTVYNTTASATAAAIGSTSMVTAPASDTNYLFSIVVSQTGATSGCGIAPTSGVTLTYTDPFNSSAAGATVPLANASTGTITSTAAWGTVTNNTTIWHFTIPIRAKASTAVSYAVSYNPGSGCSSGANYSVAPVLVQE